MWQGPIFQVTNLNKNLTQFMPLDMWQPEMCFDRLEKQP